MGRIGRAIIVGSGVAGGILAQRLLEGGAEQVTMLEGGASIAMRQRRTWRDLLMARRDPFSAGWPSDTECAQSGEDRYEPKLVRARGGSTLAWDGWSFRLKPEDFRLHSLTGRGADWPIEYQELEAYYARAEARLQVAGDASDAGHPPRSSDFPLPPLPFQQADEPFLQAMAAKGYGVQHTCIARNTLPVNGKPQCQTIGTCGYCPLGARFTGDQLIDSASEHAPFRLLTDTSAREVVLASRTRARGVRVVARESGREELLEADLVLVCAGALYSPLLLLASTSSWWPQGLGNTSGLVGRYLTNHIGSIGVAALARNPKRLSNELFTIETAMSREFDSPAAQARGKFQLQQGLRQETDLQGSYGPLQEWLMSGMEVDEVNARLASEVYVGLVPMVEQEPLYDNRVQPAPAGNAGKFPALGLQYSFGESARAALAAAQQQCEAIFDVMGASFVGWLPPTHYAHHMGTCRMSRSPERGVVDENLRIHGLENAYLCGGAVFPTGGASQPTLTIAALAERLADHLLTSPG